MSSTYKNSFLLKLAECEKHADQSDIQQLLNKDWEKKNSKYKKETDDYNPNRASLSEFYKHYKGSLGTHLKSLGIGLGTTAMNLGLRGAQGIINYKLWIPKLADQYIFGKLLGIDEGRGIFGRQFGKLDRYFDKQIDKWRRVSSDYDEKHGLEGKFNRFMNGAFADTAGSFLGWGGYRKGLLNKAFAGWGAYDALSPHSQARQLRDREAWIRSLHPLDREGQDATSTAYNQENAPTLEEYKRYHLPFQNLPTSETGKIRVPYSWMHGIDSKPINFREFGT